MDWYFKRCEGNLDRILFLTPFIAELSLGGDVTGFLFREIKLSVWADLRMKFRETHRVSDLLTLVKEDTLKIAVDFIDYTLAAD